MAPGAASLHCPNCGAAADPDARRCAYCRARLATVTCPSCFAAMFDGTAFCPKCGAARGRVDTEGSTTPCPACKGELSHDGGSRGDARMPALRRRLGRCGDLRADVHQQRIESGRPSSGACCFAACGAARQIPAVRPVRQDDEPRQLRTPLRHDRGCVPRSWHLPRCRRAARDSHVHPGGRARTDAAPGGRGAQGTAAAARRQRRISRSGRTHQPSWGRPAGTPRLLRSS